MNPHRAVDLNKFAYNEIVRFYCPMRVPSFLIIDRFVSCTHSFPMLEKNGEKRALKEGYAPSLRIFPQVETLRSCKNRKEQAPAAAIDAHLFWRIRTALFSVSNPRRKTSEGCFGLRFLVEGGNWESCMEILFGKRDF